MADIKNSAVELIGNTPILKLNRYTEAVGVKDATILAKLEYLNPAGSVKDRVALAMIQDAENKGLLRKARPLLSLLPGIQELDLPQLRQQGDIAPLLPFRIR